MLVKFVKDSYERYVELYIEGSAQPDLGTIYYLEDEHGHNHVFMGGKEYSATSIVLDGESITSTSYAGLPGICPVEIFLTQDEYDELFANDLIFDNVHYLIYVPNVPL